MEAWIEDDPVADPAAEVITEVFVKKSVGEVRRGSGKLTPTEAAFLLIANYDDEGDFEFVHPHYGGTCSVVVKFGP